MEEELQERESDKEMTFVDHLEELRWHLVRSVVAVMIMTMIAFMNKKIVFDLILLGPSRIDFWTYQQMCRLSEAFCIDSIGFELLNIHMSGQFIQHILISFSVGFITAFPYILWEFWRFLKPALTRNERTYASGIVFYSSLLFFAGVLFGYFLLAPMAIQFLGSYRISELILNQITLSSYISTVTMVTFSAAFVFELPVIVYFLSKIGMLTPQIMRDYRKHAIIFFLILAAIITPPDVTSQILLMFPFIVLYEFSIFVSRRVIRSQMKKM